jgi:hypothetical protein
VAVIYFHVIFLIIIQEIITLTITIAITPIIIITIIIHMEITHMAIVLIIKKEALLESKTILLLHVLVSYKISMPNGDL